MNENELIQLQIAVELLENSNALLENVWSEVEDNELAERILKLSIALDGFTQFVRRLYEKQ